MKTTWDDRAVAKIRGPGNRTCNGGEFSVAYDASVVLVKWLGCSVDGCSGGSIDRLGEGACDACDR